MVVIKLFLCHIQIPSCEFYFLLNMFNTRNTNIVLSCTHQWCWSRWARYTKTNLVITTSRVPLIVADTLVIGTTWLNSSVRTGAFANARENHIPSFARLLLVDGMCSYVTTWTVVHYSLRVCRNNILHVSVAGDVIIAIDSKMHILGCSLYWMCCIWRSPCSRYVYPRSFIQWVALKDSVNVVHR